MLKYLMADERRGRAARGSSVSDSQSDDSSIESSESCSSASTSSSPSHTDSLKDRKRKGNRSEGDTSRDDLKSCKAHSSTKRKTKGADDDIQDRKKRVKYSYREKHHDDRDYGRNTKHRGDCDKIPMKSASRKENPVKGELQRELHHDKSARHKEKQDYGNKHDSYISREKKRSYEYGEGGSASKQDNAKGDMKASRPKHYQDGSEYFERKSTKEGCASRRGHQRAASRESRRIESGEKHHHDSSKYYDRKSMKDEYEGRRGRNHQSQASRRESKRNESGERRARRVREWDIGKSNGGNEHMEREHAERGNPDETVKGASKQNKDEPNYELSGKLTEFTNTYKGVVIKYNEPPEARKPKTKWRIYPFKGDESLPVLYIHRQSAFLLGRNRMIADIPIDHPSCSSQHAVIQFRFVDYEKPDGMMGKRVRPYVIDLESSNGTFVNNNKIEPRRYVELKEKDVLKFGFSSREYVLLHDQSQVDLPEDVEKD